MHNWPVKGPLFNLETFSFFITLSFPPAFVSVSSLSPHCEKTYKKGSIFKGCEGLKRCRFRSGGKPTRTSSVPSGMAVSTGY